MSRFLKYLFLGLVTAFLAAAVFAAPAEEEVELTLEELVKLEELDTLFGDSVLQEKLEHAREKFEELSETRLHIQKRVDSLNQSIFSEIIIDENGTIKVMTDSGMVVLDSSNYDFLERPKVLTGESREFSAWGKSIIIGEGERVDADIFVFSGDATIHGFVEGDVIVIAGDIIVGSAGYIDGDAIVVAGKVRKDPGSKVTGSTISMLVPGANLVRQPVFRIMQGIMIAVMLVTIAFSALSIALFPRPISRLTDKIENRPIKSFLFGYLLYGLVFLIWLLLLVSVIGIPLAIFGIPVVFALVIVMASSSVNQTVGRLLFKSKGLLKSFWLGVLVTNGLPFFMLMYGYATNNLAVFVINCALLGFLLFLLLPLGLGAVLLARFGFPAKNIEANGGKPDSTRVDLEIKSD